MITATHPESASNLELLSERFEAYKVAVVRCQTTLDLGDGIAAGHAWRSFMDVFMTDAQQAALNGSDPSRR